MTLRRIVYTVKSIRSLRTRLICMRRWQRRGCRTRETPHALPPFPSLFDGNLGHLTWARPTATRRSNTWGNSGRAPGGTFRSGAIDASGAAGRPSSAERLDPQPAATFRGRSGSGDGTGRYGPRAIRPQSSSGPRTVIGTTIVDIYRNNRHPAFHHNC